MNAPPPRPELCGSTSDSMAWTAMAASTALPPRSSTSMPARAANGLAAMTKPCSRGVGELDAETEAHDPARRASGSSKSRTNFMGVGLGERIPPCPSQGRWRMPPNPLNNGAMRPTEALQGRIARVARTQLEHFPNLVTMFLARVRENGDKPFLWNKRDGAWRSISYNEAARQVAA